MSKKHKISKKIEPFITWYINTSIAEDEETKEKYGLLSVMKFNPKNSATKLVLNEVVIPYIPSTLAEVIALALGQEVSSAAEVLREFFESFESVEEAESAVEFVPETEKKVYNWYNSIDMNDLVIWIDFYGQTGFSEEDFIEVKRFYQIVQEAEQILDSKGENSNE